LSGRGGAHDRLAKWAIWLEAAVAVAVPVVYAILGVAYAVGGESAISDTLIGYLAGFASIGGLATSLVAFVLLTGAEVLWME
jgi:hypothetical protein